MNIDLRSPRLIPWLVLLSLSTPLIAQSVPAAERDALIAFYEAAGGPEWIDRTNWLGPPGTEGSWHGVTVEAGRVTELRLTCNNLQGEIPAEIAGLAELSVLELDGCPPINIPLSPGAPHELSVSPAIGALPQLRLLSLRHSRIEELPATIGNLHSLEELALSGNRLSQLPEEIGGLQGLQTLGLNGNSLTALPASIGQLQQLTTLNLQSNAIAELPPEIGLMSSLETLDLSHNQLIELPPQIGSLSSLTDLKLLDNNLEGLPDSLGGLEALQQLDARFNRLFELPPSIGDLTQLAVLNLADNELTSLPEEFGGLVSLLELNLRRNSLTSLPESIGGLTSLQGLDVELNGLEFLPNSLGGLKSLEHLQAGRNELTGLPASIGELSSLRSLLLSDNRISELPEGIGALGELIDLRLNSNRIEVLPESLFTLALLERLELNSNWISGGLPPKLSQLASLSRLELSTNFFQGGIPAEILQLTELTHLNLRHNALVVADNAILQFLNNAHGDPLGSWLRTQTLPPQIIQVSQVNAGIVDLVWNRPVSMAGNSTAGDAYQIFVRSGETGTAPVFTGIEVPISQTSVRIQGLELDSDHFLTIRTVTKRVDAPNDLFSVFSDEVLHRTAALFEFFFPYFEGDSERFTGFAVSNYSELPAEIEFSAFGPDGNLLPLPRNPSAFHLEAGRQLSLLGREIFEGAPEEPAWVLLTTDNPELAPVFLAGDFRLREMDGEIALIEPFNRLHFTRVYQGPSAFKGRPAESIVSLVNTSQDESLQVTLKLYGPPPNREFEEPDALLAPEVTRILGPRQMVFGSVKDIFGADEPILSADIQVDSDGRGVVGYQLLRFPGTTAGMSGRPPGASLTAASPQLASGEAGPGLTVFSDVKLVNRHEFWGTASLSALRDSGEQISSSDEIGMWPGRSIELDAGDFLKLNETDAALTVGSMELDLRIVPSLADVIFGAAEDLSFATLFPFQDRAYRHAVFGFVASAPDFFTGLALMNPGSESAEIGLRVHDGSGDMTGQAQLTLAGGARFSRLLSELFEEPLSQFGGYLVVESTEPIIAQVMFGDPALNFVAVVPPAAVD
jgi:Leucine-rich repeat (LRR) protein